MSANRSQLLEMIRHYLSGKATTEEIIFLESYYDFFEREDKVSDQLLVEERRLLGEQMQANILAGIKPAVTKRTLPLWSPLKTASAAAAVLLFCATAAYLIFHTPARQPIAYHPPRDITPGSNKAILTLSNGQKIDLNEAKSGELASQSGISVTKSANGELVYAVNPDVKGSSSPGTTPPTNRIETPNGGQYQVILPDGTHVWLNAASSLTYPVSFNGSSERKVTLQGEGYFEVAADAKKPFKVGINEQTEVRVLGTHFNINAYNDEATINTTLLEGAVLLESNHQSARLLPGQQAQVSSHGDRIGLVNDVNLNQVIAWKNGLFCYDTVSLDRIMRQVEKWYDVKVVYEEAIQAEFVAKLPKNLPLSELLNLLELTKQVHFKMEGKIVKVMR